MAMDSSTRRNDAGEARKWHASWIITALIALGVTWITAGTGLDMTPLILIISIGWIFAIALLWIATPTSQHTALKATGSLILTGSAIFALWWVYSYDRPIFQPEIEGLITQNHRGSAFGLDVETLVKNTGRQSGYADTWKLLLTINGTQIEGRELYGQKLPPSAVNEPEIYNQEFPPGKPVRGWLYFGFPAVSHDFAEPYFICNSVMIDKVSLKLSVWDSKEKREWTQVRSLKDLGKEACTPLQVPPVSPAPKPNKAVMSKSQQFPSLPPQGSSTGFKPIEVSLNCYSQSLPIAVPPDGIGRVIGFNEAYSKLRSDANIREIANTETTPLLWPDLQRIQDATQKYGPSETSAWRCEAFNHGQDDVLDLDIPLHVFYNSNSSKLYPATATLNPLDHGKRINLYLVNDCPVEVQIEIPTSGTARLAGEQSVREFTFEQSQLGIHGFQLSPSRANWMQMKCE